MTDKYQELKNVAQLAAARVTQAESEVLACKLLLRDAEQVTRIRKPVLNKEIKALESNVASVRRALNRKIDERLRLKRAAAKAQKRYKEYPSRVRSWGKENVGKIIEGMQA